MSVRERLRHNQFRSADQEAMVAMLVAATHLVRRLEETCAVEGITHDQYNVLRILRGAYPGGHPRYEIAVRLIDRSPDVTRLLDRLSRRQLVKRYRSEGDKRLSVARITDRGLALLGRLEAPIAELHRTYSSPLRGDEVATLTDLCGRLIPPDPAPDHA